MLIMNVEVYLILGFDVRSRSITQFQDSWTSSEVYLPSGFAHERFPSRRAPHLFDSQMNVVLFVHFEGLATRRSHCLPLPLLLPLYHAHIFACSD
jgi:hypothetical protein